MVGLLEVLAWGVCFCAGKLFLRTFVTFICCDFLQEGRIKMLKLEVRETDDEAIHNVEIIN